MKCIHCKEPIREVEDQWWHKFEQGHFAQPDWKAEAEQAKAEAEKLQAAFNDAMNRTVELETQKNGAYSERNQCVALIAKMAVSLGWPAGVGQHPASDYTWESGWRTIVFVELPTGQVSWHFHDSETAQLGGLLRFFKEWDGHSSKEKYERIAEYVARPIIAVKG